MTVGVILTAGLGLVLISALLAGLIFALTQLAALLLLDLVDGAADLVDDARAAWRRLWGRRGW